jgi:glycyl-tRNA synthetase beta subunit
MLFENVNQFQTAKRTLLENDRNIKYTVEVLKNSQLFSNLSEGEIILAVTELNERLGDRIMNFLSDAFGGDVNSIKTVLTQMKEQELKYNQEEFEIYNEFYSLLQDQKALDRDKNNPDYQGLSNDISQSRNGLNTRMKELNKAHGDIFDALETKVKDLVKDSNRKKKYFNAQRATDVLETKNDRYDKIKSVTANSSRRSQELEDFFGVNTEQAKENVAQAQAKANQAVNALSKVAPVAPGSTPSRDVFDNDPEKGFYENFQEILNSSSKPEDKLKSLRLLEKAIFNHMMKSNLPPESIENLKGIHKQVSDTIQSLGTNANP